MTDLFIEEELCLQKHRLTWELGGWAAFLRGGDIYVDHLHHNAGLTRRLRMASNGTETLPFAGWTTEKVLEVSESHFTF